MWKLLSAGVGLVLFAAGGFATAQTDPRDRELIALKKENELLQKENDLLKREVELLKKEASQAKAPGGGPAKGGEPVKVTRDNVEYEFVSIKMDGNVGYMRLAITARRADATLNTQGIRLIAADGTEHKVPLIGVLKSSGLQTGRVPEGVRTIVEFKIGQVPAEITEFATIVLPGIYGGSAREKLKNPVILRGAFKVER